MIDRWEKLSSKEALYVKWEGHERNQKAPLDKMDNDAQGDSLELELLPGVDGNVPEKEHRAPVEPVSESDVDDDEDVQPEAFDLHGQRWQPEKDCKAVRVDARTLPRFKPMLNAGGQKFDDIVKLFNFLLPPEWVPAIVKYTNVFLDGSDALHAKLTEGEVVRFL